MDFKHEIDEINHTKMKNTKKYFVRSRCCWMEGHAKRKLNHFDMLAKADTINSVSSLVYYQMVMKSLFIGIFLLFKILISNY